MRSAMKTLLLSACAVGLGMRTVAISQTKPVLPIGIWGYMDDESSKPECDRIPLMVIEADNIVHKLKDGQSRCQIKSLKIKGGAIRGQSKCQWDKSIPVEQTEPVDGGPGFSLKIRSPIHIIFNNAEFGLCSKEIRGTK